jgi:hypothetical protein
MATVNLVRYDAACRAIAAAKSTDEVAKIRNQSEALRAYARVAKNKQLEIDAAEIRIRAERRVGELIAAQKDTVGLNQGAVKGKTGTKRAPVLDSRPTLAQAGIDKKLSARAQDLARMPAAQFDQRVAEWRTKCETADKVTVDLLRSTTRHKLTRAARAASPEEFTYLVGELERRADVRVLEQQCPERFAADAIFDVLTPALEEVDHWAPTLDAAHPGRYDAEAWRTLLHAFKDRIAQIESWMNATAATQGDCLWQTRS